ncbi:MAG: hypothetical protein HY042_00995 [Spirochaetia bacterium]|nr:hypothetical protein [Spirochaetia bacterium]
MVRWCSLTIALILGFGCLPPVKKQSTHRVILAWQDTAYRCAILLEDMGVEVKVQPMSEMPYSSNGSAAVWVGTNFPFEKARDIIEVGRRYYTDLRYVALSDFRLRAPEQVHNELFVGGATETALFQLGLKAWDEKDFQKLKAVKTQKEFFQLICSHYPKVKNEQLPRGTCGPG